MASAARDPSTSVSRGEGRVVDTARAGEDLAVHFLVDAVHGLHANGANSDRVEARAQQIGQATGLRSTVVLGWSGSLILLDRDAPRAPEVHIVVATPTGLGLNRVYAIDRVIDALSARRIGLEEATGRLGAAAVIPATSTPVFAGACMLGACALAVLLGAHEVVTVLIVALSAGAGALVRRGIARLGGNTYWQVGAAAAIAGVGGAGAGRLHLDTALGLAALCPCLVLVPGPHILKGALDLVRLRVSLGAARLLYSAVTLVTIGAGVLTTLWLGHASLAVAPATPGVQLWIDLIASSIAAVCYGIFYSSPFRLLWLPFVLGMLAHGLHWVALGVWGAPAWLAAGIPCLVVGAVLQPLALRMSLPFSAVGFASVVSLLPGALVLRALAGLFGLQSSHAASATELLVRTVDDATSAALVVLAMTTGLLVPAAVWRRLLTPASPPLAARSS